MALNRKDDAPQFNLLRNSNLVCADCILANDDDLAVATCKLYTDIKPGKILDGGECEYHITAEQALKKYGKS